MDVETAVKDKPKAPPIRPEDIEANKHIYDQHFDPEFAGSLAKNVLSLLNKVYFRSRFIGFDDLPERNNPDHPLIYVSNHSGMAFPWDAIVFCGILLRDQGYEIEDVPRPLAAPALSGMKLMNPFLLKDFWKRAGGIDATFLNFETMMHYQKTNLMIYPEGIQGIGKGFNKKYQLQRFSTSFVKMSIKYKTDVIPYATVNGEYINPYTYSTIHVNRHVQKLGIPFLPLGLLILLLPFQPWLFYLAWPAKLTYVRGKRISPYTWTEKAYEDISEEEFAEYRDRIHAQMQQELDEAVIIYGQKKFMWREHFRALFANLKLFPYTVPTGWPFLFSEFDRVYQKTEPGKRMDLDLELGWFSFFKLLWRNPFTIWYFVPIIGWIPIALRGRRE